MCTVYSILCIQIHAREIISSVQLLATPPSLESYLGTMMVIMNRETIFLSAARQLLVRLAFAPVYQRAQPQTHPSIIQIRFDMQKSELQAISMQSRQENTHTWL